MNKKLWFEMPETKALIKDLETRIQDIKDQWAEGNFTRDTVDGTSQKNAEAIGFISGIVDAIDFIKEGVILEDD